MPLFMDRHDLPGVTPGEIARAHTRDLEVAGKHNVEFLSYWVDPDRGGTFCLARASAPEKLVAVHEEAHGLIPNEIIAVSEDAVLRSLGVVRDPPTTPTSPTRSGRSSSPTSRDRPRSRRSWSRRRSWRCSPSTTS